MELSALFMEYSAMLLHADKQIYTPEHAFCSQPRERACHTLELTYSGVMLRRVGEMRRFRPQPNHTLLLVPPYTHYALRGRETGVEIWLMFVPKPDLEACLQWPPGDFGIPELRVPGTPLGRQVLRAFEDVQCYASGRLPRRDLLSENSLERLLLLAGRLHDEIHAVRDERIQKALDLIRDKHGEPLSVGTLADTVSLSCSRFAHLFRQETGVSPMQYLERIRLEQAQGFLLRTDLQIKDIAGRVGFSDPFYFSSRFRKHFGCPPTAWRNQPRGI